MMDDNLEHGLFRNHKYIAKVGKGKNARYFYTQEEYDAYRIGTRKRWSGNASDFQSKRQAKISSTNRKRQADRFNNARKSAEESNKAAQERQAAIDAINTRGQAQTKYETAKQNEARQRQLRFESKTRLPDKISLKDFLTGGQYKKDLKSAKKAVKETTKKLKKEQKKADKLYKQISELNKKEKLSLIDKVNLANLKKEYKTVRHGMRDIRKELSSQSEDLAAATVRYENATLIGSIKKTGQKAKDIIGKYTKVRVGKKKG